MVEIEKLVLKALQGAGLAAYVKIPSPAPDPVMQVHSDGGPGPSSHMPNWLWSPAVEIQTWGSTEDLALGLVVAADAVLRTNPSNEYGAITRYRMVSQPVNVPDEKVLVNGRPMPRYIAIMEFTAHPAR